jgi:hypothetical protein
VKTQLVAHAFFLLAAMACGGRSMSTQEEASAPLPNCRFELEWERDFSGERGYSLEWMVPGRVGHVLSGRRFVEARESAVVLAIDERGALLWERHLEQQGSVLSAWGEDFVVAGSRRTAGGRNEVVVTLLGEGGEFRWEAVAGTEGDDHALALVVGGDALGVVGLSTLATSDQPDTFASVIEASGRVRFARAYGETSHRLGGARDEIAFGGMFDATGKLVVAAKRWIDGAHGPLWVFALDAAGNLRWERVDDVASNRSSEWRTTRTQDGGLVIVGELAPENGGGIGHTRIVRLNEHGAVAWTSSLDEGAARQSVAQLRELDGGGFVGVGRSYEAYRPQTHLLHFDATGSLASVRRIDDASGLRNDLGPPGPSARGGFWLAGAEWDADHDADFLRVVRIDSQGHVIWSHESPGTGVTSLHALEVDAGQAVALGTFSDGGVHESRVMMLGEDCSEP